MLFYNLSFKFPIFFNYAIINNSFNFSNLVKLIFSSIFIILLSFITVQLVSINWKTNNYSKTIKIVEKLSLGVDRYFILIQVQNHFYLVYVSKNGAQVIDKIDSLEIGCNNKVSTKKLNDIISSFNKNK